MPGSAPLTKRNIKRTPDFPHGRSIKWPKVYRGLRRRGMSKEKAARISNAMANKFRGGRRLPLSAKAGKKGIPEDILDKRPDLRKGQPDVGDVHISTALKAERKKRKRKKKAQLMMKGTGKKKKKRRRRTYKSERSILHPRFTKGEVGPDAPEWQLRANEDNLTDLDGIYHRTGGRWFHDDQADVSKHMGPGPHPSGSPQSVHGRSRDVRGEVLTFDPPEVITKAVNDWFERNPDLNQLDLDWHNLRQDHDFQMKVARHYDSLPEFDESARESYDQFSVEIEEQFDYLTEEVGIEFILEEEDPYANVAEAAEDLRANGRLRVLATEVTGGHPMISDDVNDKFRFVHDIFGHIATGRNFDRHGEEAAFLHHASMFSTEAIPAMASETRGQNASLIANREFGPQRAALMEPWAYELRVQKHEGPGPHPGTGTEQTVHAPGGRGVPSIAEQNRQNREQAMFDGSIDPEDLDEDGIDAFFGQVPKQNPFQEAIDRHRRKDRFERWRDLLEKNRAEGRKPIREGIDDNEEVRQLAKDRWAEAMKLEEELTPTMEELARLTDGELKGIPNRVKTTRSLRRKIVGDALENKVSFEEAANGIHDVNRYTITWENDHQFAAKADQTLDLFSDAGWTVFDEKDKNGFPETDHYDGINIQFTNGSDFFEVQFHTPESYEIKDRIHPLFSRLREDLPKEERDSVISEIANAYQDRSHVPPGIENFGTRASFILKGKQMLSSLMKRIDYWIFTYDGTNPDALYQLTEDGEIERYDFESGTWVESIRSLPEIQGLGGSSDYVRVSDQYTAQLIKEGLPEKNQSDNFSAPIEIAKSDEFKNLVFGWASVAFSEDGTQLIDRQGHAIDIEDLEDAAYDFTVNKYGSGDMHKSDGFGELVESMVFTKEKIDLLGLDANSVPQGWWVGFRVPPEYHEEVRTGNRTMFSIEGTAKLEPY